MEHTLRAADLEITVNTHGAEWRSLKKAGLEYLWQADPAYWGRHAPVLFPIVGRLKSDLYTYGGHSYHLPQHGFARDRKFRLVDATADRLQFELGWDESSLQVFPFRYHLQAIFSVTPDSVSIRYVVSNRGGEELYFSIGAHPAFQCPVGPGEAFEDYYLEFSEPETLDRHYLSGGLFNGKTAPFLVNAQRFGLTYDLFEQDAIVFHQPVSRYLTLGSDKSPHRLTMDLEGAPYLGIWTKPGAPFICLEPWQGIADRANASGRLEEKAGIISLEPGAEFGFGFSVRVG